MLFRNIIVSAILIGILSGLILSLGQHFQVSTIIYEAEKYEASESTMGDVAHAAHSHEHGVTGGATEEVWSPDDGSERIFYTIIANILSAIGFAVVLLSLMSLLYLIRGKEITMANGLVWGLAGFLTVFIAPSLGLPPEIPGMQAAAVEARQVWWISTVFATAAGLAILAFAPDWIKLSGIILILLPHIVGAPHTDSVLFAHADANVVQTLTALYESFLWATTVTNGIFWIVLGGLSGMVMQKWQWQEQ